MSTTYPIPVGVIPQPPYTKIQPPPEPTIANLLDGLDMFWGSITPSQGELRLSNTLFHLPDVKLSEYSESTKKALQKKGWREHPLGGALFNGAI